MAANESLAKLLASGYAFMNDATAEVHSSKLYLIDAWDKARHPPVVGALMVMLLTTLYYQWRASQHSIPYMNKPLSTKKARDEYLANTRGIVNGWFRKHPNKPAMLYAENGPICVLPWTMAEEIKNDERLSLHKQVAKTFYSHIPGFEVFRNDFHAQLRISVIKKHLNKQLVKITNPLAQEAKFAVDALLTDKKDWHEITIYSTTLELITRLSSFVFLGPELCRDPEWIRTSAGYAGVVVTAWGDLNHWPSLLRPLASRFVPTCKQTRAYVDNVRKLLQPAIEKRHEERAAAVAKGLPIPKYDDAIDWFDAEADGKPYDSEIVQLMLSVASVHTATDLLAQVISDIASHPEIIQPLRDEMVSILKNKGWQKNSLDQMKLLDSVIKESQRVKPSASISMGRMTTTRVKLSDGTVIPKDTFVCVDVGGMWNPDLYDKPSEWDGHRFNNLGKLSAKKQNFSQLITTAPEHLPFGYGVYECPGRFFAANEIKVAVVSLLLAYDLKFEEGITPRHIDRGVQMIFDPRLKLSVRRRPEPILDL